MILDTKADSRQLPHQGGALRRLGPFEELLWQMDKRSPLHATLVAEVVGSVAIDAWRDALELTRRRHPLWSAVISKADGKVEFQDAGTPEVALRVIECASTQGWKQEVARELSVPIDTEIGPLVRAVLMHADASCMLILSAHHSICDGMSLVFALRDLLQAVSGTPLTMLSLHSSQEDALGMGRPPETSQPQNKRPCGPSVYRPETSSVPEVSSLQLSFALTEELLQKSRRERTTVHAAIVAAAGLAARQAPPYGVGRNLHLCSTINNRKLIGSPEDCGVFFTACDFLLAEGRTDQLWELARGSKLVLTSAQGINGAKAVLSAVVEIVQSGLDDYSIGEAGAKLFQFDIHVSNLGNVSIPTTYGEVWLRALWGPGVLIGFEGEQTLGVSTLNGRLCLLHTSHRPLASFLEDIESVLRSACGL